MDAFRRLMQVHTQAYLIFTLFLLAVLAYYNTHLAVAAAVGASV